MRNLMVLFLAVLLIFAAVPLVKAQQEGADKPGIVVGELITLKAMVEDINYAKRTVVLKGPEGQTRTIKVDNSVKNFAQVKKGDEVLVEFYESLALFVRKANEPPVLESEGVVETAKPGEKPAIVEADTTEITASVEAIDYIKRTITLKGPRGNSVTLKLGDQVKKFNEIKVGDEVVAQLTEALAISVQKPK